MHCHAEHALAKFWGVCNEQKWALDACLREEKAINRCVCYFFPLRSSLAVCFCCACACQESATVQEHKHTHSQQCHRTCAVTSNAKVLCMSSLLTHYVPS